MRTPLEIYDDLLKSREGNNGGIQRHKSAILAAIEQACIEAIEQCAEDAGITYDLDNNVVVDKDSILAVKNNLYELMDPEYAYQLYKDDTERSFHFHHYSSGKITFKEEFKPLYRINDRFKNM